MFFAVQSAGLLSDDGAAIGKGIGMTPRRDSAIVGAMARACCPATSPPRRVAFIRVIWSCSRLNTSA